MAIHPLAGKPAPRDILVNVSRLISAYYTTHPDSSNPAQQVSFGTSGHRGTAFDGSFNEDHIVAICQAICDIRSAEKVNGPLFLGMDTHALSEAAFTTGVEVFAANGVQLYIQEGRGYTPTPVISHAILTYNRGRKSGLADGVVITPSHNPPDDGGIKYNPPNGGPADAKTTKNIQDRANDYLKKGLQGVRRIPFERAIKETTVQPYDYINPYISDLKNVVDMGTISASGLHMGIDPLGGSGIGYWEPLAEMYGLDIDIVNKTIDPTFSFMPVDRDGKIRMDCSSPYAMAGLIHLKDKFDIAFGNDPDYDRHGIVTRQGGLMNPNHYLAVAVWYLFRHREAWKGSLTVGKTLVSSSMIDRVAHSLNRTITEVPVGFKWFVDGLYNGTLGFGGEESAGATFLRIDGTVWTTDKDGIIMDMLAAEITAKTGRDPSHYYDKFRQQFGDPVYERIDAPATPEQKAALAALDPGKVRQNELAGEKIEAKVTRAPGNKELIGGLKVITENGWFAARPSGTEDVYKIYAESFRGREHLRMILEEAKRIVDSVL